MTETFTVRFCEREYYDIFTDEHVVELQAIASNGTWTATVPDNGLASRRQNRQAFKDYVLQAMALRQEPKEVTLGC